MSYVPEKHRGAQSIVQFFGIPLWLSLAILTGGLTVGALLSTASGSLGLTYVICFVISVIAVAILTEPKSIFLVVASTPLLFCIATVITGYFLSRQSSPNASSGFSTLQIGTMVYPLLQQFPVLITATVGAAALGIIRLMLLRRFQQQAEESTTRERRQATETAKRSAAQASRARSQSQRSEVRNIKERVRNRAKPSDSTVTVEELLKRNSSKREARPSDSLISPATGVTQVIKTEQIAEAGAGAAARGTKSRTNAQPGTNTPQKPKVQRRQPTTDNSPPTVVQPAAGRAATQQPNRAANQRPRQRTVGQRGVGGSGSTHQRMPHQHQGQPTSEQQRLQRGTGQPHTSGQQRGTEQRTVGQQRGTGQQRPPARQRASAQQRGTQQANAGHSRSTQPSARQQQRASAQQQNIQHRSPQQRQAQRRNTQPADRLRANPNNHAAHQPRGGQPRSAQQSTHDRTRGQQRSTQKRVAQQRNVEQRRTEQPRPQQPRSTQSRRAAGQRPEQLPRTSAGQRAGQSRHAGQPGQRSAGQRNSGQRSAGQRNPQAESQREQARQRRRRSLNDDLYS